MSAFDTHPYPIVLAKEITCMFTNIERSYFEADVIWSQDLAARIFWYFYQCTMDLTRSFHLNKTDSKLTASSAGCC